MAPPSPPPDTGALGWFGGPFSPGIGVGVDTDTLWLYVNAYIPDARIPASVIARPTIDHHIARLSSQRFDDGGTVREHPVRAEHQPCSGCSLLRRHLRTAASSRRLQDCHVAQKLLVRLDGPYAGAETHCPGDAGSLGACSVHQLDAALEQ